MAAKRKRVRPTLQVATYDIDCELADVTAIKAFAAGQATPEQQARAYNWIMYKAAALNCGAYDSTSTRNTDFTLGRQFVAKQIAFLQLTPMQQFRLAAEANDGKPRPPRETA